MSEYVAGAGIPDRIVLLYVSGRTPRERATRQTIDSAVAVEWEERGAVRGRPIGRALRRPFDRSSAVSFREM